MALRETFRPGESALPSAPIIYHLEDSSTDGPELVARFFADPVAVLDQEFPGEGFESHDDWTVQTHVVDHHLFWWGWIWTMTAVVVPEYKQVVVTAVKHPRKDEDEDEG